MALTVDVKNKVGIDIGKRGLEIVRRTHDGRTERFQTGTDAEGEKRLYGWLRADDMVVMEAGNQAFRIAKHIMALGNEVVVLNPGDVMTIYASLRKTDKEDALKLARLAERHPREELPSVCVPSDAEEDARRLSTEQAYWSRQVTQGKNRLHGIFAQAGLTNIKKKDLSTEKHREKAVELLPLRYKTEANRILRSLREADGYIEEVEKEIVAVLQRDKAYASIAMSMPGIGPVTALALYGFLGDCKRFSRGKQVGYYVGLVPRVDQSGDTAHYGRIVKRGCAPIRRVVVQAAWALVRSPYGGTIRDFYKKLAMRIGKKKAIVAVSRKMMETFYAMMTNGEQYRGVPQSFIDKKFKLYGLS